MFLEIYNKFLRDRFDLVIEEENEHYIKKGKLIERKKGFEIPIYNYIPRFSIDDYCESFGLQWDRFKNLQHDSKTGYSHSYNRIVQNTEWILGKLAGKSILECGCGPGRFTEIFIENQAEVVSVDMSRAVDINLENCGKKKNLLLLQSDITKMPFFYGKFDFVFCYGVLQHTPNPEETFKVLVKYLKPGGRISVDIYRKQFLPTCWTTPKYLWRPITKRMKKETLLKIIEWYIPKYLYFDTFIKKIPKIGCVIAGLIPIPCWNYIDLGYSRKGRIRHAILDTFDALSSEYDIPKTKKEIEQWFSDSPELQDIKVFYGSNGIVGNAKKKLKSREH